VGVSQTFQRGTKNGITELLQTARHLYGRAAITLGIGPHFLFYDGTKRFNNFLGCATNSSGSDVKVYKRFLFQHGITPKNSF